MSVSENMIFLADVAEFTAGAGEFIALEVALGYGLAELHELYPERVPNPIVVNRWARKYPAFGILMEEAEVAAAQKFAYETVKITDDPDLLPAMAGNRMKSRQWLASKLSKQFGTTPKAEVALTLNNDVSLTDEQLMAIAAGGLPALEHEGTVVRKVSTEVEDVRVEEGLAGEAEAADAWDFG
jgi:hypothetical protein